MNDTLDRNYQRLKVEQWKHNDFILTNILECPLGIFLVGSSGTGQSGKKYSNYRQAGGASCSCHVKSLPASEIESVVLKELKRVTRSPQVVKELITEANLKFDAELPDFNGASLGSRRKLSAVMKRLDRVGDEILDSSNQTQRSIWLEKQMRLQTEKVAFEAELKELEIRKTAGRNEKLDSDKIQTALDSFFLGFIKLPIAARQSFLSSLLVRVVVEKDELKIEITNPGFSMSYESEDSVNLSGQKFAQWDEWLPRRSNVRTELHSVATH